MSDAIDIDFDELFLVKTLPGNRTPSSFSSSFYGSFSVDAAGEIVGIVLEGTATYGKPHVPVYWHIDEKSDEALFQLLSHSLKTHYHHTILDAANELRASAAENNADARRDMAA